MSYTTKEVLNSTTSQVLRYAYAIGFFDALTFEVDGSNNSSEVRQNIPVTGVHSF